MTLAALVRPADTDVTHLREHDLQRLGAIEQAITDEVTRRYPDATSWSVAATSAASGRPTHFYFDEPVAVQSRDGRRREIALLGTPAAGAAYELSLYLPARQGVVHTVAIREGVQP